jgi:oligopeptidase A
MHNPLLDCEGLPPFAELQAAHIKPAIEELLRQADAALERTVSDAVPADYDAVDAVLSLATERLGRAWSAVNHLNEVRSTPEWRSACNEMLPAVTDFHTRLGSDERLFAKYKAIAASPAARSLSAARQQALRHWLRDFVLSGAELQGQAKARYAQIQERSAELSQQFSEHVMDATDGFAHYASADELTGVPADVLASTRAAAEAEGKPGHKITLHLPCYLPVMQYATLRPLRELLYRANATRASELGPAEWDNSSLMQELLALRQEEAGLLGYQNFAELSLVPKMAQSPQQVLDFLRDMARRAMPYAQRDLQALREFAQQELAEFGLSADNLQAWDLPFVAERLKLSRYAFSAQELKQYFTLPRVLHGLFKIVETLFDVVITEDQAQVWHDSVRFFRIECQGQLLGQFYLDLHARSGKRPGAWMDEVRSRWLRPEGELQTPVAHLVCNFAQGVGEQPALLTHDDLITLFHEFGHGLHHLLTRVQDLGVAGTSGVEWDAVELPSQFMENFCWEWEVLKLLSAHVDSGEALPRELFEKMLAARNFQSGMQTMRQIEFALIDMRLHAEPEKFCPQATASQHPSPEGSQQACDVPAPAGAAIQALVDEVRREASVFMPPDFNRAQHSFSHIFGGGYAAGYYSYQWAEVLSADAWSAFEEEGVFNPSTGRRYLENILEVGSSRPAMESFKAFRGREPRIDALLRHLGMSPAQG